MDKEVLAAVVALVAVPLGWALSQLSTWLGSRGAERAVACRVIFKLIQVRTEMRKTLALMRGQRDLSRGEEAPREEYRRYLIDTHILGESGVAAELDPILVELASIDPAAAARIERLVRTHTGLLKQKLTTVQSVPDTYATVLGLVEMLYEKMVPGLDHDIGALARRADIRTWWRVRRYLRTDPGSIDEWGKWTRAVGDSAMRQSDASASAEEKPRTSGQGAAQ